MCPPEFKYIITDAANRCWFLLPTFKCEVSTTNEKATQTRFFNRQTFWKRLVSHYGTADSDFRRDSEACSALRLIQVFLKSSSLYSNQTDFARLTEQKRHFALDCCGSKPDSDDQA